MYLPGTPGSGPEYGVRPYYIKWTRPPSADVTITATVPVADRSKIQLATSRDGPRSHTVSLVLFDEAGQCFKSVPSPFNEAMGSDWWWCNHHLWVVQLTPPTNTGECVSINHSVSTTLVRPGVNPPLNNSGTDYSGVTPPDFQVILQQGVNTYWRNFHDFPCTELTPRSGFTKGPHQLQRVALAECARDPSLRAELGQPERLRGIHGLHLRAERGGTRAVPAQQPGHWPAGHRRHGPGRPDPHRRSLRHRRRRRLDQRSLRLPVAGRRLRHLRRHVRNLHPDVCRTGQGNHGASEFHRLRRQRRVR